ncbi:MAG: hypothetical protein E6J74_03470 [Deltaproteobacteria bacterium]|nr:MAG: hypothetical protein E6J74_03470 [Deltaproteobacteria bacterium]
MRQAKRPASYPSRFADFEIRHSARLGDVFEHFIDANEAVPGIGDGAAGGDDFDERHDISC